MSSRNIDTDLMHVMQRSPLLATATAHRRERIEEDRSASSRLRQAEPHSADQAAEVRRFVSSPFRVVYRFVCVSLPLVVSLAMLPSLARSSTVSGKACLSRGNCGANPLFLQGTHVGSTQRFWRAIHSSFRVDVSTGFGSPVLVPDSFGVAPSVTAGGAADADSAELGATATVSETGVGLLPLSD